MNIGNYIMDHFDFKAKIVENNLNSFNVRDEFKNLSIEEIRQYQPKNGFAVCLINILGDLNVGTIIRSAVLFGADKVYLAGRRKWDRRSCVGAQNYIDIEMIDSFDESIDDMIQYDMIHNVLKKDGWEIVCAETGGKSIQKYMIDRQFAFVKTKPCFVFGSEGFGIPQSFLDKSDHIVMVDQPGVMRSLNVASAASIFMYEFSKNVKEI